MGKTFTALHKACGEFASPVSCLLLFEPICYAKDHNGST